MKIAQVAPDLRPATRRMPAVPANLTAVRLMRRAVGLMRPAPPAGVEVDDRRADGVPVRVYLPRERRSAGAMLWIHGGGLVLGSVLQDETLCAATARRHGITVVSVDYRLAPEHPFPAALDDCLAAWQWMQRGAADLRLDPGGVVVGGQSAGGGLAAALVQRVCDEVDRGGGNGGSSADGGEVPAGDAGVPSDRDTPRGPLGQWLFCPMLDDRTAADRHLDALRHRVWTNRANRMGWAAYLGVEPGAVALPDYASPARRADLGGLPPAWIGTGDIELFFDEDRRYAERLRDAGVPVRLDVVHGAPHGFEAWARGTATAAAYLDRAHYWLGRLLRPLALPDPVRG